MDLIDRQENIVRGLDGTVYTQDDDRQGWTGHLPPAQHTQNTRVNSNNALDTISRQQAIDALCELPSAQPERKKGKWESFWAYGKTVRHRCSECLAVAARDDFGKEYLSDYCTVCGADMRGGEHATD